MAVKSYETKSGQRRYLAEKWQGGRRIIYKQGFKTRREAVEHLESETTRLNQRSEVHQISSDMGFKQLGRRYLDNVKPRMGENTYRGKKQAIRRLIAFLAEHLEDFSNPEVDLPVSQLQPYLDDHFNRQAEFRGGTASNRDLKDLKALLNWGIQKNFAQSNPFRTVSPFPEREYIPYVPPPEDIAAVRMVANSEEREFFDALYYTAGRLSEICRLTWDDINFEDRTIRLWTKKRKGGNIESRTLHMADGLYSILWGKWQKRDKDVPYVFHQKSGKALHRNVHFVKFLFDRLCKRANVKKFTAHGVRHHVSNMFKDSKRATSFQIKDFLGHQRLTTTETYLKKLSVDRSITALFDDAEGEQSHVSVISEKK